MDVFLLCEPRKKLILEAASKQCICGLWFVCVGWGAGHQDKCKLFFSQNTDSLFNS